MPLFFLPAFYPLHKNSAIIQPSLLCRVVVDMLRKFLFLLLLFPGVLFANQLVNHPSPYLALHGNDPVDWHVWSKETLDKAKRENKLLFVSVGYFACHWCHVMQRESFSDVAIAKKLNKHFIAVKVDRELNPVLDNRLMTFLQATTGRGGWPMNVILTPDRYPVAGMVYLPPERFSAVLDKMVEAWQEDRKQLEAAAREVDQVIAKQLNAEQFAVKDVRVADLQKAFLQAAMQRADELGGGFGDTMKFPSLPQLAAMIRINRKQKDKKVDQFIHLTLDKMVHSGLHDAIGHGFFRYTVDPDWQTPHFEKMLYTNAQMARLYLLAADVYQNAQYRQVAIDTLDFMQAEMRGKDDAMITSLSAVDDKNIEGGFYLWRQEELKKILTDDEFKLAVAAWNLDQTPTFEAGVLPVANATFQGDKAALEKVRQKLLAYRKKHHVLPRDEKRLASLNGLALAACADGLSVDRKYSRQGQAIVRYLLKLWDGSRLHKALDSRGNSMGEGALPDYAAVAHGLLQWGQASGDRKSTDTGKAILRVAWKKFHTIKGWRELETSLLPNPLYQMHLTDSAEPSAEALLVQASLLALETGNDQVIRSNVEQIFGRVSKGMYDEPYFYASLIAVAAGQ